MMHRDLSSSNVLLTTSLVAKLCDFRVMKATSPLSSDSSSRLTTVPGAIDFMPPQALVDDPQYGLPLDVFSFGCVVCHVITQQWPTPLPLTRFDPNTRKRVALSQVERRMRYIDQISDGSLQQLVMECLDDDQEERPPISLVSERIISIMTG